MRKKNKDFYVWTMGNCIKSTYEWWGIDMMSMYDNIKKDFPNATEAIHRMYDKLRKPNFYKSKFLVFEQVEYVYEALAKVLDEDENRASFSSRQDLLSQIVLYIETTYAKTLSPADLMIINNWIDLGYSYNEIKKAVLDSLKAKKMHLRYADAILANRKKVRSTDTVECDDEIREMLNSMYVK